MLGKELILSPSFLEVILISPDINFLFIYILFLFELSKSVGLLINLVNIFPLLLIIVVPGIFIFLFIFFVLFIFEESSKIRFSPFLNNLIFFGKFSELVSSDQDDKKTIEENADKNEVPSQKKSQNKTLIYISIAIFTALAVYLII